MKRKREREEKAPPGGWLGPPPTQELKPLAIATKTDKKGRWVWEPVKQTRRDRELRKEWERRNAKAERKGNWHFKWPPKDFQS